MSVPRIASLVPSLTELLCALGLGGRLVARTGFCIHPRKEVVDVAKVGGTKDPDLSRLRELAPTHVLVNVDENRLETVLALRQFVPHVIATHPCAVADNLVLLEQLVQTFADQPGVAERAAALRADFDAACAALAGRAWPARSVLYLIWRAPWMSVARDTYIASMLASVNWQTLPAQHGGSSGAGRYPALAPDAPEWREAELVLLSSEPYRFGERHLAEVQALAPQARVLLVDGELLSWYGPRAATGLRYLGHLAQQA
ncbi:helical backbone metal receptor [Rivibacter subsaxonicus]|uniref:Fe/B12 periplasmic-binding domain-containing protein n=1 Tax=Rivibacter subsaxonicus TaxID=457575 RepID=A0A4Q7VW30_9BURK|nr:helical backbone metal receptor [Rivibacter subsaxonicus]RZU00881.1 hypothetical protein EV670_1594 [Rivibacter subsaxonicus]